MAKPLAAILKSYSDVIAGKLPASEVNKLTLGKEPGVDYDPKMPDEREFVASHSIEKHPDRAGNGPEVYNGAKVKQAVDARHGNIPNPKSKNQYKQANEETKDEREYGYEGDMAITQLKTICRHSEHLMKMMKPDTDLPEWVQSKITKAEDYISTAHDYLMSEMTEEVGDDDFEKPSDTTAKAAAKKLYAPGGARSKNGSKVGTPFMRGSNRVVVPVKHSDGSVMHYHHEFDSKDGYVHPQASASMKSSYFQEEVEELDELKGHGNKRLLRKVEKRATNRLIKATDPMWTSKSGMSDTNRKTASRNKNVADMARDRLGEEAEELDEGGSQYRSAAGSGKNTNPNLSKLARKLAFEKPKYFRPPGEKSKAENREILDSEIAKFMKRGGKIRKEEVEELDEAKCNMTEANKMCEVHGMKACPKEGEESAADMETRYTGKKKEGRQLITDKKTISEVIKNWHKMHPEKSKKKMKEESSPADTTITFPSGNSREGFKL